jgi:hypothetical protein
VASVETNQTVFVTYLCSQCLSKIDPISTKASGDTVGENDLRDVDRENAIQAITGSF